MKQISLIIALIMNITLISAQEEIKLYPKGTPESNGLENKENFRDPEFIVDISEPRMYAYPAPKETANGAAVLICPGGGYSGVSLHLCYLHIR